MEAEDETKREEGKRVKEREAFGEKHTCLRKREKEDKKGMKHRGAMSRLEGWMDLRVGYRGPTVLIKDEETKVEVGGSSKMQRL